MLKLVKSWQPETSQSPSWPQPLEPPLTSAAAVVDSSYTISKVVVPLLSVIRPSLKPQKSRRAVTVQSLSHVQLFATPWTAAHQVPLFFTVSKSLLKFMSIESVILSNCLILCHPLLLLPSIFPSIKVGKLILWMAEWSRLPFFGRTVLRHIVCAFSEGCSWGKPQLPVSVIS